MVAIDRDDYFSSEHLGTIKILTNGIPPDGDNIMFKPLAFTLCVGLAATSAFADTAAVRAPVASTHNAAVADATSDRKQAERLSDVTSDRKQAERLSDVTSDRKAAEQLSSVSSSSSEAEVVQVETGHK
jgi:hypothetical protein